MSLAAQAGHVSASPNTFGLVNPALIPLGIAPVVRRPVQWCRPLCASFFDLRQWGGDYLRVVTVPGRQALRGGLVVDMQTGQVWLDGRVSSGLAGNVATAVG